MATSLHFAKAFSLERSVADGQDFVDEQDFRFEMRGHGEGEAHVHAAAIVLHRGIDEMLDVGEGDDLVELAVDFALAHAEDGAVQIDVFAAGELGVKAGADFEQAADAAANLGAAFGGAVMRERIFSSVVLPAPLRPMMPTTSPSLHVKGDVLERPDDSRDAMDSAMRRRGRIAAKHEG